jgi:[ribosomal protein S5]-alanine N-acetyltransferase
VHAHYWTDDYLDLVAGLGQTGTAAQEPIGWPTVAAPESAIRAARMDLVLMSPALMRAMLAADWDRAGHLLGAQIPHEWRGEDWQWLGERPERAECDPSVLPWLPRVMLLRAAHGGGEEQAIVVGEAGFHGPPDGDGRAEVGYMVVSEHRLRGYAEEAVRALIAWAATEHHVTRFRASISPENTASLNLISKLGFVQVGTHRHEIHGEELIFHRDIGYES